MYYVGILDGAKDLWGIRIPDVPGCYGAGATPEAAIEDAISALREVAAHWAAKGVSLDAARSVQEVIADPLAKYDSAAGESIVMVPLLLDRARPVKANISLDAGLLEAIDQAAKEHGLTRSAFFTSAAVDRISKVHGDTSGRANKRAAAPDEPAHKTTGGAKAASPTRLGKMLEETRDQLESLAAAFAQEVRPRSPAPRREKRRTAASKKHEGAR